MCPVVIASKTKYTGTVTPAAPFTETTVVDIPPQTDDYMVEGYIDISTLREGDALQVTEYVALDGVSYSVFTSVVYQGPVDEPLIRFHTKTLPREAAYRVTVNQLMGTLRSIRYAFIVEVMGVL